jgi:hypothetical protein
MYSDINDSTPCCHIIKNNSDNSYKLCNKEYTYNLFCSQHSYITNAVNTPIYITNRNFFNKLKSVHKDLHQIKEDIDIKKNIETKIIKKLINFCNEKENYKKILAIFSCECNKKDNLFQKSSYLQNICINHLFDCCHFINNTFNNYNSSSNKTTIISSSNNNINIVNNNFISKDLIYTNNYTNKKDECKDSFISSSLLNNNVYVSSSTNKKDERKDNFISSSLLNNNVYVSSSTNKNDINNINDIDSMLIIDENNFSNDKPDNCPICMDDINDEDTRLHCGHWAHLHCLLNWKEIQKLKNMNCPVCRQDIDLNKKVEKIKDRMVKINIYKILNDTQSVSLFIKLTIKMLDAMNNTNKKKLTEQDKNKDVNKLLEHLNKLR